MSEDLARVLVGFFAIIDPIGNILAFEAVAGRAVFRTRLNIALLATGTAFVLLALFAVGGTAVLDFLNISPESFQIAAGVLLVLPAIRLVEHGEMFDADFGGAAPSLDAAVVPLALPMLSGPGALALAASYQEQYGLGVTLTGAGAVLVVSFAVFASTGLLLRFIHPSALRAFARIIGVLLMAIAVDFILSGWLAATG